MRVILPIVSLLALAQGLASAQEKLDPTVEGFRTRLAQPGDREPLRQEASAFLRRSLGKPAATQTAAILNRLPSPLDHLDPQNIPELDRFGWQPKELVAVLGEHRGRHGSAVTVIGWTPDGKRILSGGQNGFIRAWDPNTLRQQWRVSVGAIPVCMAISRDSKVLAVGAGGALFVWDISGEKPVQTGGFNISTSGVHDVHISPDGKHLAAGVYDGLVHLFHLDGVKPKTRTQLSGHQAAVTAVRFSPGNVLTTASTDGWIRYWNVSGDAIPDPLAIQGTRGIGKMDYSPNGAILAISVAGDVELWVPRTKSRKSFKAHSSIAFLSYSRTGYLATCSADGTVKCWNPPAPTATAGFATLKPYTTVEGHFGSVAGMAWNPDGRQVATGGSDWTVRLWGVGGPKGTEKYVLKGHWMGPGRLQPTPTSELLATGGPDRHARIWDLSKAAPAQTAMFPPLASLYKNEAFSITTLAFTPDGKQLALGGTSSGVKLWDVEKRTAVRTYTAPTQYVSQVLFTPDGQTLVGHYSATIFAWAASSGRELYRFSCGDRFVNTVALSLDGRIALSGSGYYLLDAKNQPVMKDGKYVYQEIALKLFDLKTGKSLRERDDLPVPVSLISFRPDGQPLVTRWNTAPHNWETTAEQLREGKGFPELLKPGTGHPTVFSPDGRTYLSAALNIVDVDTGKILRQFSFDEQLSGYTFTPDGRHLLVSLVTGPVYVLRLQKPPEYGGGK